MKRSVPFQAILLNTWKSLKSDYECPFLPVRWPGLALNTDKGAATGARAMLPRSKCSSGIVERSLTRGEISPLTMS